MSVRLWKKSSYNSTTFESKPQIIEHFFSNEMDGKVTTRYEIGGKYGFSTNCAHYVTVEDPVP